MQTTHTHYRTHTCGELRMEHVGQTVTLAGFLENVREVGQNFAFAVLRDFYGVTQVVVENEAMWKAFKGLNKESTVQITGVVRERDSKNPKLPTGDIEVVPEAVEVLGRCRHNELPFQINRSREADESARLKYRYLDLRNPEVKNNIILRCQVVAALRKAMLDHGFLEITTPILTASSPEGARDYLVPSRKHPGKFYALPQAPQQFKQLLMASGFDKYFQIAPCFRDEDARGDRSPGEFYQLDMEMAFADQEDVFAVLEDVLPPIFARYGTYNVASTAPFRRISYREAMDKYGSDKPDLRIDLIVTDATEGETWYDYFADKALEQLAGVQAMNAAAEAEGFTWNDEMQADLDDTMESLASAASTYGYTEKQYLGLIYGSTMTRSIYEEQTRRSLLATAYLQSYQDSLTYSTDELEAAYQEDRTAYDLVDCAYVRVNGAAADTDEEGNSIEVTDEMKAEAMAAAKTTADAIYAAYKAGTSLEDAAAEYESTATYASSDSFSYSSSVLGEWLYDDARQAGDSAVLEDSDSSNYYVVVFNGRSRNEYNTVNVRHILIQPEASELSEDDEGYEDDVAAKDAEAAQKAQDILDEWKAGDATEDSFAALANEYSQDPGSNTTGGLYEQVYQGQMVTEFNDWCFDPARQTGDTGIIHNESTGYHVMYFVGYDQPYWEIQVSADLVNDAVDTFYEEKTEGYTAEQSSFGMSFVG